MNKLNVCVMGQNCERFIGMCLKSVQDSDSIIYCDGGSTDNSTVLAINNCATVITNEYIQSDKGMNGKQRQFYLDYLKKHHLGEFCLCLDADEVLSEGGIQKLKELINKPPESIPNIISIKMRHFIESFGKEDATVKEHFVLHRLFKITKDLYYPEIEHPVLNSKSKTTVGSFIGATVWHLAYCPGIFDIRKRYLNHLKKSEMHTKEYLDEWYMSHLFGYFPKSQVGAMDIPKVILDEFLIPKDKIYFRTHSNLETKHFIMSKQWITHFGPSTVLDLGAGIGLFGYALDSYGINYFGIEKSQWAIDNTKFKHLQIQQGDITEKQEFIFKLDGSIVTRNFDLVLVLDVLEHLEEEHLMNTLNLIKNYGTNFLFSIPYDTDPNIDLDLTHLIKKPKEWWVSKLSKYFKITDVPEDFMYGKQMLIGVLK